MCWEMDSLGSTAEAFQKNLSSTKDMYAFVVEKTLKIIYIYEKTDLQGPTFAILSFPQK